MKLKIGDTFNKHTHIRKQELFQNGRKITKMKKELRAFVFYLRLFRQYPLLKDSVTFRFLNEKYRGKDEKLKELERKHRIVVQGFKMCLFIRDWRT